MKTTVRIFQLDDGQWVDVTVTDGGSSEIPPPSDPLYDVDALALRDAFNDRDLPKMDDFGDHLLVILHGLRDHDVETYEVDCFLSTSRLLTIHSEFSPSIDALWAEVERSPDMAPPSPAELLATLADVLSRRLLNVVDEFELQADELISRALNADANVLMDISAIRSDISNTRRVVYPQRETLDKLRHSQSVLINDAARRRFSDVFDVALRTSHGLDGARTALSETLDAYRGAEARSATDVNRVLTIYAAIMLPLSLVASFFGMNHRNLPTIASEKGWVAVLVLMVTIALLSLYVFGSVGWIRRPSARRSATTVGSGLVAAAKAPVEAVVALTSVSRRPRQRRRLKPNSN